MATSCEKLSSEKRGKSTAPEKNLNAAQSPVSSAAKPRTNLTEKKTSVPSFDKIVSLSEEINTNPADFSSKLQHFLGARKGKEREQALVDILGSLARGRAKLSAKQYVATVERDLTGNDKGLGYNSIVINLIESGDPAKAEEIISEMPISQWREREMERYYKLTTIDAASYFASLRKISAIEVKEDRERALVGVGTALSSIVSSGILTEKQAMESASESGLTDAEIAKLKSRL